MPVSLSSGNPGFKPSAPFFMAATNLSKIGRSTYTRSVPKHTCPLLANTERMVPSMAASKSQSANTMAAFLPPISRLTGRAPCAAAFMIAAPVRVSPVKVIAFTSGWVVTNSPAESGPKPCTTLYTPGGTPTLFITSPNSAAVCGVSSEGFTTTVLPQASAGPTFQVISSKGRFQGQITPTTPTGRRME